MRHYSGQIIGQKEQIDNLQIANYSKDNIYNINKQKQQYETKMQNTSQSKNTEQYLSLTLQKVTQLEALFQHLSSLKADKLEQETNSSQYLDLLATMLYSLMSVTHSYAHLKSVPVPQQFEGVKVYFQKIKDVLANKQPEPQKPTKKLDKEVATRLINRSL